MTTVTVTLPESLSEFVARQVSEGGHASPEEFIRHLILEDQKRRARERVDALLLEGLQSPAREMTEGDWQELRRRVAEREARKNGT
jgi:antitoxin ParD1/3/4